MIAPITDPEVIAGYLTDASNVPGCADALVRPETAEEVAEILAHCQAHRIPVTVTAARTSTTAAAVPMGGWLLSMERMNRLISIENGRATAEGGIFLGQFQAEVEEAGGFYPPDPTSRHECTLGASIACNASGARTFRYGPTRPYVESLEVVLPTGEIVQVGPDDPVPEDWPVPRWGEPNVKTAAGYVPAKRLLDLFIGQEGTLGVITRATVRLLPEPPEVMGVLAWFSDRSSAVAFMEHARQATRVNDRGLLSPRCIEYLDHHCLDFARQRAFDVPQAARAALFCEQEQYGEADDHLGAWWEALCEQGALADDTIVATDRAGQERLHALRHAVPAGINERVVANGMPKVGTDLAVPDAGLSKMMDAYEASPMEHVLFGHLGNNHLHLNLLPRDPEELRQAKEFYDELARLAISLGGTISAEHGVGKLKTRQLAWMVGPEVLEAFRLLKARVDPAWILGRGNLINYPDPGA